MDTFCPKLMNCEDPITVIAEIISKNSQVKAVEIENKFKSLGLFKVKHLAGASLKTVYTMNVGDDSIAEVYKAIEIYEAKYTDQFKLAKSEFDQENFIKTQELCYEMISRKPDDVTVLNLLAASYYKCGDYHKALKYFTKILDKNPKYGEVFNNLGSVKFNLSQYDEACNFYHLAIQNKANYLNGWINYASALFKANDLETADCTCRRILTYHPKLYKVRNMSGSILMSLNKTEEAKKQFKIAKNECPGFSDIWYNLGFLYLTTDKIKKAILNFEKSSELNPYLINTWINLGVAYWKQKQYAFSVESFKKVLLLCPENVTAMENLATLYEHHVEDIPLAVMYYEKLLKLQPSSSELNLKLGFLYFSKLVKYQESEPYFKKCIELNPLIEDAYKYLIHLYELKEMKNCAAEYCEKLGDIYMDENNIMNARFAYTHSVVLDPENATGHWKLGLTLHKIGHFDLAISRYSKAIGLKPNFPDVYYSIALVYESMDFSQKAIVFYKMALQLKPDHKNTLLNISNLEFKLGNFDNVAKFCEKITEIDSSKAFDFHFQLADIFFKKMSNFNKAIYHYEKALNIDSTCFDIYLNVGNLLLEMNNSKKALGFFRHATELNPQCVIAYTNIGSIYKDCGNFTEAIHAYRTALNIEPDLPDTYCVLVQCLRHICDWSDYDLHIEKVKDIVHKQLNDNHPPSLSPYQSLLYPFSSEILKKIAEKYADQCFENILSTKKLCYDYQTSLHHEHVRVGYVCSDFGDNPTSQVMKSIASFHDRSKIEVFFYILSPKNPLSWSNFSSEPVNLKDITGLNIVDAANLINKDGINILVNINGYKMGVHNEIFALRPTPVQVLWLGFSGTSGARFFDYLITDKMCSPLESKQFYTEKLAYLDRTVFIGNHKKLFSDLKLCVQNTETDNINTNLNTFIPINNGNMDFDEGSISNLMDTITPNMCSNNQISDFLLCSRQDYNIPEDAIVYCNFSQLSRIDPSTFNMWLTILHDVPNSILWLMCSPAEAVDNLRKFSAKFNVDASRIVFSTLKSQDKHMVRFLQLADVFLDTPLCDDHTKCLDAIWAGIPVVTLPKETFASRIAASQLTTLGYTRTIAENEKHYMTIATELGTNKVELESNKKLIWSLKSASNLYDFQSYAEKLETVYTNMWTKFLSDNNYSEK